MHFLAGSQLLLGRLSIYGARYGECCQHVHRAWHTFPAVPPLVDKKHTIPLA